MSSVAWSGALEGYYIIMYNKKAFWSVVGRRPHTWSGGGVKCAIVGLFMAAQGEL